MKRTMFFATDFVIGFAVTLLMMAAAVIVIAVTLGSLYWLIGGGPWAFAAATGIFVSIAGGIAFAADQARKR